MYPNLKAEMARRNITVQELSHRTGIPYTTLYPKLRGERPIKISDAEKIREAVGADLVLDVLFSKKPEVY